MPRGGGGHGHEFPDGLVEARVGAISDSMRKSFHISLKRFFKILSVPKADWKMLVLHEVLDMAHLVMDRVPLFEAVVIGAHLDPVVLKQRNTCCQTGKLALIIKVTSVRLHCIFPGPVCTFLS